MRLLLVLVFTLFLPACATVVKGTDQVVQVSTDPAGSACTLERDGVPFLSLPSTPAVARVDRSMHSFQVRCSYPGYQEAVATTRPHFNGVTLGNALVGGVVGLGVDLATGASFTYPDLVRLSLAPLSGAGPAAVPVAGARVAPGVQASAAPTGAAPAHGFLDGTAPAQVPAQIPAPVAVVARAGQPVCPAPGLRALRSDGTSVTYEGADPADPGLCVARVAGVRRRGPFGLSLAGSREAWRAAGAVTAYLEGQPRPALRFEQVQESRARDILVRTTVWVDQETGVALRQMTQLERGMVPGGMPPDWQVTSIDATGAARL